VSGRTLLPTAGALTALANGPRGLRIDGWVSSLAGGLLEGFRVFVGPHEQSAIEWRVRRASSATSARPAATARPRHSNFRIAARPLTPGDANALITVTPRFAGRNTTPLFGALHLPVPLPPKRDREAVAADFLPKAFRSLSLLVGRGGLRRDGSVLDVGCGVGRVTYPLGLYLSESGRYEGIDAVPRWVDWNRETISARLPNFQFRLVPVQNGLYSRHSHTDAGRLRFPFDGDTFDAALVESVLQHNRAPVVRHYLAEIARVLRGGGRCVVTCFLLRRGVEAADQQADGLDFFHRLDDAWSASARVPETGIAFEAARFEEWVSDAGLELAEFHRGDWHRDGPGIAYQDVIILEKPRSVIRGVSRRRR